MMTGLDAHKGSIGGCGGRGCVMGLAGESQMEFRECSGVVLGGRGRDITPLLALRPSEACVIGGLSQGSKHGNQGPAF